MSDGDRPFRILGWHLKLAREQLSESLDEVSGAVEIDTDVLERIELGKTRPSEDILLLLINHLGLEDAEANSLWEMAGYVSDSRPTDSPKEIDLRIIYTDLVNVIANDYGIVINFLQASGLGSQPLAVSRVGMSKEQASCMLELLQQSLDKQNKSVTKSLPANNKTKNHSKKQQQ